MVMVLPAAPVSKESLRGVRTCHSDRLTVLGVFTSHRLDESDPGRVNDLRLRFAGEKRRDADIRQRCLEDHQVRPELPLGDLSLQRETLMMVREPGSE